jgi:hypothetical protein
MDFSGCLVLPVTSLLQRPLECDCPGTGTIINTAAAIPAFIRMQYNRRFAFLWIGHEHIYLTNFYAGIAPVAEIGIKDYRSARCRNIWYGDYFFLRHFFLQKPVRSKGIVLILNLSFPPINTGVVFIMGFILHLHVTPEGQRQFSGFDLAVFQFDRNKLVPLRRVKSWVVYPLEI